MQPVFVYNMNCLFCNFESNIYSRLKISRFYNRNVYMRNFYFFFFFILKECYTLVLKGYIDLANVKFMKMPSGPYGINLHVLICIIYHYRKKNTEWYDIKNTGLKNNLGNLDTFSKNFLSKSNICFRVKKGVIHIGGPSKSVKLLTKLLYKVLAFLLTLTHS